MTDQLSLNMAPIISPEAQRIYDSFCAAITKSNKGYDRGLITLEHRNPKSGAYDAITIGDATVFRVSGKRVIYLSIQPKLIGTFELNGYHVSKTKSSKWGRIVAADFDFTECPAIASAVFEAILRENGFGCCSRYEACSDAGHCIHPDVMFAAQCSYRQNLHAGKIFYGKNKNI